MDREGVGKGVVNSDFDIRREYAYSQIANEYLQIRKYLVNIPDIANTYIHKTLESPGPVFF